MPPLVRPMRHHSDRLHTFSYARTNLSNLALLNTIDKGLVILSEIHQSDGKILILLMMRNRLHKKKCNFIVLLILGIVYVIAR